MKSDWKEQVMDEMRKELEALEAAGKAPKDISELETLTIAMNQKMGKRTFEAWMQARAKEAHFELGPSSWLSRHFDEKHP